MSKRIYKIVLTDEERSHLHKLVSTGKSSARKLTRARTLLLSDEGVSQDYMTDKEIARVLSSSLSTVERTRQRFVLEGLDAALTHKRPCRTKPKTLDGDGEARLCAVACSNPPDGRDHWTLQLLADRLIELSIVETICDETVRQALKKMNLSLG